MLTRCPNQYCGFDVSQFDATVELDGQYRTIFCPACQTKISEVQELPQKGVFYDDIVGGFFKWVPPIQATTQAETIESLTIDRLTIKIQAKTLDYSQIFYKYALVFFQNDQIIQTQIFAPPESYRRYGIEIVSAKMKQNNEWLELKFRLKGGYTNDIVIPALVTESFCDPNAVSRTGSALKIWPNFKRPAWQDLTTGKEYSGWADYFVYFASSDIAIKTEWLRIVGEKADQECRFDGSTPKGMVGFVPEVIEICAKGTRDGWSTSRQYYCSLKVELITLPAVSAAGNKPIRLAIDFGTSNTCFAYLKPGSQGLWEAPVILRMSDKTRTLVDGLQLESDLEHTWFPSLQEQELLPSELVFPNDPQIVLSANNELMPILNYTIPPLKWRSQEQKLISSGFKWRQSTEPPVLANRHQDLQKMYLAFALRLALAELVSSSDLLSSSAFHPYKIDLFITYPLSMTENEYETLLASFDHIRELLSSRTGIELEESATVDESYAGEIGTIASAAKFKVFVDVGGGTTDVSLVEIDDMRASRDPKVVDSVRYAGNDFLRVLANDEPTGKISTMSLIELQRRIRMNNQKLLEDKTTFGGTTRRQEQALKALHKYNRGLTEYLARIVALKANELGDAANGEKIDVYLLGNGWRFLAFSASRDLDEEDNYDPIDFIITEMRKRLNVELGRFVHAGIIKVAPQFEIYYPIEPKMVVARGALLAQKANRERREPQTFLGSNVKVVGLGSEKSFSWTQTIPLTLEQSANGVFIESPLAGFEMSKVHDFRYDKPPVIPLERADIRSETLSGRKIIRNAFNVYLEKWYKRYLNS
jgi:hypothetical protein